MKLMLDYRNLWWWFWAITLVFIIAAVGGWTLGYYAVIIISAVQVLVFLLRDPNVMVFPNQIRIVYFAWTLFGLWPLVRLPFYILLMLGTIMVVFFGRCSISLLLKSMPWNRNRTPRLY